MKTSFPALALLFLLASSAGAATLSTPLVIVNSTDFALCIATNVGKSDANVTVELKSGSGAVQAPSVASCGTTPATLAPGAYCFNRYAQATDGYCVVSGTGKIRAALEVFDSGFNVKTLIGATK